MPHPVLRVQLLGGFNLVYNNAPVIGVNPARLQSLLAYLILHADSPQSRQQCSGPQKLETTLRGRIHQERGLLCQGSAEILVRNSKPRWCWN
jgi:hypothetical protein